MLHLLTKITFALFCLTLFAVPLMAQEDELGTAFIRTGDGFLMVHNGKAVSYTLEFKGNDLKPLEAETVAFTIDKRIVQIVNVARADFWKSADAKPTDEQLLQSHKAWESDYVADALKAKLSVSAEPIELAGKRKALYWFFPMPKELKSSFSHQVFLTTIVGNDVLGISSSLESAEAQAENKAYLVRSMQTLQTSDKPFNLQELSKKYREAPAE